MKTFAFIFARGGSKELPGKNIRNLNGVPLLAHSILKAKKVKSISRVFVSTDDEAIAKVAIRYGAEVIERPVELAGDNSPEWLAWRHAIEEMKMKYPDKDIAQAKTSFLNYPYHQGKRWTDVEVAERFGKWCAKETVSHQKFVEQFQRDSCGFPMAYCQECGVSESYEEKELYGDSKCCNSKLLPTK